MLENILEQIKERFKQAWDQIQETEAYAKLKEKYDNLNPSAQKLVLFASAALVVLLIAMSPLLTISDSSTYIEEFETKRELTRELLRATKEASEAPNLPTAPSGSALVSQIQLALQQNSLLPEQIESVSEATTASTLIPQGLSEGSARVQLRKLNLRQLIEVGFRVNQISPSLKMNSMKMTASPDLKGYFDIFFEVTAIKIPRVTMEAPEEGEAMNPLQRKRTRGDSEDE